MSTLTEPRLVVEYLRSAGVSLSCAHAAASEQEDGRTDLNGPVRDLIFGVNTALDALVQMIKEGRFVIAPSSPAPSRAPDPPTDRSIGADS